MTMDLSRTRHLLKELQSEVRHPAPNSMDNMDVSDFTQLLITIENNSHDGGRHWCVCQAH